MDDSDHPRDLRASLHLLRSAMNRTVCDQCDKAIGRVDGDWFGVDHARLDEDGELIEADSDYQFHFCSPDCVITWLMNRSYDVSQPPTEATT